MFIPKVIGEVNINQRLTIRHNGMTMMVEPGQYPAYRQPGYAGVYVQLSGLARSADWEGRTMFNYFVPDSGHIDLPIEINVAA